MGKLEQSAKKRRKNAHIRKLILHSVAVTGILAVGLIAPNVLGAMAKLGMLPHRQQKSVIKRSKDQLIRRGYISFEDSKLRLTEKGKVELRKLELESFALEKPKRWDGKWRLLIFDIPEYRKSLREKVRRSLKAIGFIRLQDSVWLYPYECEDLMGLLKADFKIGKDMLYLIVEEMEYDRRFKEAFGLR